MQSNNFIFDNLEVIIILASPAIIYGVYKLTKFKVSKNDLTPLIIKLNKKREAINKKR